jgi:hypothetical protein
MAAPGIFKYLANHHNGAISPMPLYVFWWIAGFMTIACGLAMRHPNQQYRRIVATFVLLPLISLIAHLGTTNWVYKVDFQSANLSPLLLGIACIVGLKRTNETISPGRMAAALFLPVLAILWAMPTVHQLNFGVFNVSFTPLRLTLIAAALVYLVELILHHKMLFGIAGAACLMLAYFGDNPDSINKNLNTTGDATRSVLWRFLPSTIMQWGVIAIVSAFILLGIGSMLSLRKPPKNAG